MRYLFWLLTAFAVSSCGILELPEPDPTALVRTLQLDYDSYTGLLGNTNLCGTICNNGTQTVGGIEIRARTLHSDKTYDTEIFSIPDRLPPNARCSITHKLITVSTDEVVPEMKSATAN